jgi:uncharacterized HAD superfamily protein
MRICIDIDNCIADTFNELTGRFNRFAGRDMPAGDVIEYMRRKKLKMVLYWFITWKEGLLAKVKPIPGAADIITKWHRNNEIALVTSRLPVFNRQTRAWLKYNGIPYHELHHARERSKYLKAQGCNIFIEDNIDECEILADHCEKVFLIDHPWNRKPTTKKNIIRVTGLNDIKIKEAVEVQ